MSEMNEAQTEFYKYVDSLVEEMNELAGRHGELVEEYDRAMTVLQRNDWRAGYVHWVDSGGSVEGGTDG